MLTAQKHAYATTIIAFSGKGKGPNTTQTLFPCFDSKVFFALISQPLMLRLGSFFFNACFASAVPASE
jgi:hypothetical protein